VRSATRKNLNFILAAWLTEISCRDVDFREQIGATLTEPLPSRIIFPSTQEHVPSSAF
jgi:hypothetical protein